MKRDADGSRNSEAQILAQLRRRSAESSARQEDDFLFDSARVQENDSADSAPKQTKEDRTAALKRLVSSNAPKEPMSALSSTIRGLREELNSDVVATYAAASRDETSGESVDATLDLVEAELESQTQRPTQSTLRETDKSVSELSDRVEPPTSSRVETTTSPRAATIVSGPKPMSEKRKSALSNASDLLVVSELRKGYVKGKKLIPVLQGVDLTVKQSELLAIVGQSGSGKSTLLHLMGTLDIPDSGTIHFDGQRIDNLPCAQRDVLRNHFIGMIFQFYHLIPEMTTLENVLAPLMIRDSILGYMRKRAKYVERAKELLDMVGLSHRLKHRPNELSGGEMQRASIARALITDPRVLLADEPTGNLDSKASIGVLELLRRLNEERGLTIVMVTHDMSQAQDADRAIRLVDGMVVPE